MAEELIWVGHHAYEGFVRIVLRPESRIQQDAEFWEDDIFFFVDPLTFVDTSNMVETTN